MRKSVFIVIVLLLGFVTLGYSATYYTRANGNWNASATWSTVSEGGLAASSYPVAGDIVNIGTGSSRARTVTIPTGVSVACATLNIGLAAGNTRASTLTFAGTASLTVSADVNVYRASSNNRIHTITLAAGTLNVGGDVNIGGGPTSDSNRPASITLTTGSLDISGNLAFANTGTSATAAQVVFSGAGNMYIGGNFSVSGNGTLTPSTGRISFDGTTQTIANSSSANISYYNLTLANSGTKTFSGSGTVTTNSGGTLTINNGVTLATSNLAVSLSGSFSNAGTFSGGSSAIAIAGTGTQSIGSFSTTGTVSMTKTGGTATLTGVVSGGVLTINGGGGTLNLGAGLTHTFPGIWTRTNGTLNGGSSTLRLGSTVSGTGGTFTASTGTVEYYASSAQAIAAVTYNNLTLTGTSAKTTTGATVNGILSMEGTASTTGTVPTYGTAATIQYKGSAAQTSGTEFPSTFAGTGGVIVANTSGNAVTLNAAKTLSGGPLTINTNAILTTNNYALSLAGNFVNNGTFNAGSSDITMQGTANQSIAGFTTTGTVSMTKTGGTASLTGNVNGGALTINGGGGTLNLGTALSHTFTGTWTRTNGTLNGGSSSLKLGGGLSGTGGTFTANTGTVEYNALAAQSVAALVYYNLILAGTGTKTVSGTGPLTTIAEGTLTINNGVTLATNNIALSLAGNFTNNGSFSGGSSAIAITGSGTQSVAGLTTTGTISMTKTAGTASLTGNVNGGALTINGSGGTLNLGTGFTHTFTGVWTRTNGTLNAGSSTLRLGSTVSGTGGTFTAGSSTVEYYASSAQTIAQVTYNNLTLTGTSAKTISGATINGLFTIEGAATTAGTVPAYGASSSLRYNGLIAQTVGIEWPSTFARPITIVNTNGVTLNASKAGYSGTLTNNGKLISASFQLTGTVNNNGTISAARTDIMSSGTLSNNTGSTIDYTIPLNIPASTGYYNLDLSSPGIYYLTGNVTGINVLNLVTPTTFLHTNGYTLGYASLTGPGSILAGAVVDLASDNPAVAAANISQASLKNPVYRFTLSRDANVGSSDLTGLSFNTTGTATTTDITNYQLWTNSTNVLSGATKIGTDVITGQGAGNHNFGSFSQALPISATQYFWITADIRATATTGRTITVSALSTSNVTLSDGTKTGAAFAAGTQTITAMTTTLASTNPAQAVANIAQASTLNPIYRFSLNSTGENTLTAFSFRTTASAPTFVNADKVRFQLWSSTTDDLGTALQVGANLTTMAADGSDNTFAGVSQALATGVTRYFWITVDLSTTAVIGHRLTVTALTTARFTVTGTKAGTASAGGRQTVISAATTLASENPAIAAANIGRGTNNNPIYRFTLTPNATINVTGLNFVATGTYVATDIVNFKLWSSTTDAYGTATQVGTTLTTIAASGSQQTFAAFTRALTEDITRYFWITADLNTNAVATHTIIVSALTTARVTVSVGTLAGTAYVGGAQTIANPTITLSSNNPAVVAGIVSPSSLKNPIYRFILVRDAATGTVNLTGLTFTSTGTYAATHLTKFQLWGSATDNLSGATQIGTDLTTSLGAGAHTFATFSRPLTVSATLYLWITTDLSGSAITGRTIAVSALTTTSYTISLGNKDGVAFAGNAQTVGAISTTLASNSPAVEASLLAQNQLKRPLHRFTLSSNGNINLSTVSFISAGDYSASDITKFQLWTGIVDDVNAAGKVGSDITSSLGTGSHSFGSLALPLTGGLTQYFWISTDAAATAAEAKTISVSALSTSDITLSSGSISGSTSTGDAQTFCVAQQWMYAKGQTIGQVIDAGTNFQIRVKVYRSTGTDSGENIYVANNCRADFGDIRFFEGDAFTVLDYWMESAVYGTSAIFWVEMNGNLSLSNLYLTMKCGNPSVTTTSNGGNTFPFFDDFNRTDDTLPKWTKHKTLDGSTISIPKGTNYVSNGGGIPGGTFGHTVLGSSATYSSFSDGIVEYKFRLAAEGICEVGFRGTFGNPGSGYKARSDARTVEYGGQSFLTPPYYGWAHLIDTPEPNADRPTIDTWYRGTIKAYGSALTMYLNETLKSTSAVGTTSGPGEISLQNHYGQYSEYDWVFVRKYASVEPTRGTTLLAPIAVAATALCHNGFTARWNTVSGATGYKLDVLAADGLTFISGWQDVSVSLNVHRVEIVDISTAYKYKIRAVYSAGTSPSSNVIDVSTTAEIEGVSATTSIEGASILAYLPLITGGPTFTDNNVNIDPTGTTTDDFSIVVTYEPAGYDVWPNARLLATITCSNNDALNGTYTLNHAGLGFTPASAAMRFGAGWLAISPTFSASSTVVTISGLSKGAKGVLEIVLDNGSGTLPVELSSFLVTQNASNQVQIQWITQSETNVSGFRLYRGNTDIVADATLLNVFISATNTSQTQVYLYVDKEVDDTGFYYYWLENVDLDGTNMLHGPVTVDFVMNEPGTPSVPIVLGLNSVYPNPFNPSTTIKYGVTIQGDVDMVIYNVKGQIVRYLLHENKGSGTHSVTWNGQDNSGRNVSTGVYFVRMSLGGRSWSSKLVLLK